MKLLTLNTNVTDDGLENLKGMTHLERLDLTGSQITDAGLEHLKGLKNLRSLDIRGVMPRKARTGIVRTLTRYVNMRVRNANISDEGVKNLQQALPNCEIIR